jgi:hypothetical protein
MHTCLLRATGCSHDCLRIDWRTVHGLQCHIVKIHEQPKGTIGSLEKALDRYGVLVSEVEEYERLRGPGSGGTMADPKNAKISRATLRTSEIMPSVVTLGNAQVQLPSESPTPPAAPAPNNLPFPKLSQRTQTGGFLQNDIVYSDDDEENKADVKEVEKADDLDAPTGVTDKPSVQEDTPMPSLPTATETNAPSSPEASLGEDTEMTSPSVANKEAPDASVIGDSAVAETNLNSSDPAPMHEPSRSTSPTPERGKGQGANASL